MNVDTDSLISRFEFYSKALRKYFPDSGMESFLDDFGTRLATCPRGLTEAEGGLHGSLVSFLSQVAMNVKDYTDNDFDTKSAVRVALVHELGKLGDESNELFIEQESSWHREKLGQNFKYNENCKKMSVSHRTLYLLQKYEITLTDDEWLSILISQGMHYPENGFYAKSKPYISSVLDFSRAQSGA